MKKRVILIALATAAVGTAGIAVADHAPDSPAGTVSASVSPVSAPASGRPGAGSDPGKRLGYLEGDVVYPGEGIPGDIRVCAANLATARETCTGMVIRNGRSKSGRSYRLGVPAGNYQVYATVPSFDPGYQAFYSAFVVCGYHVGCTDHSPITVHVTAGKVRTGIEPGDFYD